MIGTLRETELHAALKAWCARPGDVIEAAVGGSLVDIARDGLLIEIQTGHFAALRPKLRRLLADYPVRVVYPLAVEKWICRLDAAGRPLGRRKSPKRGRVEQLFAELVYLGPLAAQPNFSLEVVFIQEEAYWQDDGRGSWRRRGWSVAERRLLAVIAQQLFAEPADYLALLPAGLSEAFTNSDLAAGLRAPRRLAEKMSYCLLKMGLLEVVGMRGRARLYAVTAPAC